MNPQCPRLSTRVTIAWSLCVAGVLSTVVIAAAPPRRDDAAAPPAQPVAAHSEADRLVTGAPDRLQSVVAGFPVTAVMKVVPVGAKVGSYPPGTTISGNQLTSFSGGFRAWFEFKLSDWDPDGNNDPPLSGWQIKLDTTGFLGANANPPSAGVDLTRPAIACTNNAPCQAAFGEAWATCETSSQKCRTGYVDSAGTGRSDSWCADTGSGACQVTDCSNPPSPNLVCFAIYAENTARPDGGIEYYAATAVLDVPATAPRTYTVNLLTDETFMFDTGAPPNEIPTLSETGFVVRIVQSTVQACCLEVGGCSDMDALTCANNGDTPQGEGTTCETTQCGAPTGACCDQSTSTCTDGVLEADCSAPLEWTAATLCVDLPQPCLVSGACCDSNPGAGGACVDDAFEVECSGPNKTWTANATCAQVGCSEVVGACCDPSPGAGGACADGQLQGQCTGPQQVWTQGATCAEVNCQEARGSCCNTSTFDCNDNVLQGDCQGPDLRWRQGATCGSCTPGPQLLVTPVPARVGSYPAGTTITEQEISFPPDPGPVRMWFDAYVRNWDPNGDGNPPLYLWQIALDHNRFLGTNAEPSNPGVDLTGPVVPCANHAACATAFGDVWAECEFNSQTCKVAYADRAGTGRPDSWCRDTGNGACSFSDASVIPPNKWFAIYPFGVARPDEGITYYGGTLVLDLPAGAMGRYTVPALPDETFMADTAQPPNDIPTYEETGFTVVIRPAEVVPAPSGESNRSLAFSMPAPATATATGAQTAIRVRMLDLQHPNPRNVPQNPPPNFNAFDTDVNSACSGGQFAGHHCHLNADCTGTTNGTCPAGVACDEAAVGAQGGCARWVGPPQVYLESNDLPDRGGFRGARLQCTPYYHDWGAEGMVHVSGAEVIPSSRYQMEVFGSACKGAEDTCTVVSAPVTMVTRRFGDVASPFNPPETSGQPDALDVSNLVNKFKNLPGAPSKAAAQLKSNFVEPGVDMDAIDIVVAVSAFKGLAYPFSGPCLCPSTVPCGVESCANDSQCDARCEGGANSGVSCEGDPMVCLGFPCRAGTCTRVCVGGPHDGHICVSDKNCRLCSGGTYDGLPCAADADCGGGVCPGAGTCAGNGAPCSSDSACGANGPCNESNVCASSGSCADRCGRCTP